MLRASPASPDPATPPDPRARAWRLALLPAALVGLAWLVALPMPQDRVTGHIVQATLLAGRPFLCLAGALLQLYALARWRRPLPSAPALLAWLALSGLPPLDAPPDGPHLRVVSANLDAYSEGPPAEGALAALRPDVLFLIERRTELVPGLDRVADNYGVPMERPSHGHAVHCRPDLRCAAAITAEIGSDSSRMPVGLLRIAVPGPRGEVAACLLSLHAPPPAPLNPTGLHPYVQRIARQVRGGRAAMQWGPCQQGDPVLAIGDFNTVPGTPAWRTLRGAGLADPQAGRGVWRVTWPAGGGWPDLPWFALDHALVGEGLVLRHVRRARVPGADHMAITGALSAR